ncbi:efflux RND transporter periplasmic adaptor subunit [Aestuariirhabdus litorea]|uniref:Efflux RND transporter periplasmic adaptor subunit n=2 Tax=Aestuariirhabdus litorea TaxID=2528527 RepID=A0A3P3VPA0_9GAMM|nr:efflux RND transporter periplasmic adaptor subunit [Aestuariirhabdus litorea]RWW93650.1 efflux RND transporter periplasmic adaptor subunit [Endozoicomonadaceae bacterium GTF-13]
MVVSSPETASVRVFPGVIDANQKVELAFRVSGKLKSLPVREGEVVTEGQVIAQLDPADYQIVERDRKARYQEAKANFDRAAQLLPQGYISKADYDRLEATFKSADAALSEARQNLEYTTLKAPFSGRVAKRLVENFQEVQAKQTIVELQDTSSLEVKIDIPESDVKRMREDSVRPVLVARFGPSQDQNFALKVKEYSTVADTKTQTFRVTLSMDSPTSFTVLPGMTTSVVMHTSLGDLTGIASYLIPLDAVHGDIKLDPQVWVVDASTMTLKGVPVKVGAMHDNSIEVVEGLQEGDRIVTAGVAFLTEGQKVRLMKEIEQAEPMGSEGAAN